MQCELRVAAVIYQIELTRIRQIKMCLIYYVVYLQKTIFKFNSIVTNGAYFYSVKHDELFY